MDNKTLLIAGGAVLVYFLTKGNSPALSLIPGSTAPLASQATGGGFVTYGINSGVKGGNGSFYTVANYDQLANANPNLLNPNYQLTPAEIQTYLSNYSDLQTGLPTFVGNTNYHGIKLNSLAQAAQAHWNGNGCAEKRIFLPLQPPSTAAYIPPPPAPSKSSGGGFLSSALGFVGSALPYVAAILGTDDTPLLNDADQQALFTAGAIITDILPLFANSDPTLVAGIREKLNSVLLEYS